MARSKLVVIIAAILALAMLANMTAAYDDSATAPNLNATVTDIESELALSGAMVSIVNCSDSSQAITYNTTDSSGNFLFNGTASYNYTINVSKAGYATASFDNSGACFDSTVARNFTLEIYAKNRGSITFTVKDEHNGRPIPNATVTVISLSTTYEKKTGSDGVAQLFLPADGSDAYFYNVTHDEYKDFPTAGYETLSEGQDVAVGISMQGSVYVESYVTDLYNNMPLNNTLVELVNASSSPLELDGHQYNATTNEQGYYRMWFPPSLNNAGSTSYGIRVTAAGYDVTTENNNNSWYHDNSIMINVSVSGSLAVAGSVLDNTTMTGVANATVMLADDISGLYSFYEDDPAVFKYVTYTDSGGNFSLKARNSNNYTITASKPGFGLAEVEGSGTNTSYLLILNGTAKVEGTISDATNNSIPIQGASVTLYDEDSQSEYKTALTDANGDFGIWFPDGMNYHVNVSKNGYLDTGSASYNTTNTALDLTLAGAFVINGTVKEKQQDGVTKIGNYTISGAAVKAVDNATNNTYSVTSGSDGSYSMNIPGSIDYSIEASKPSEYATASGGSHTSEAAGNYRTHSFELSGSTNINGTAYDSQPYDYPLKKTLSGVNVTVYGSSGNDSYALYWLLSGPDGNFSVDIASANPFYIYMTKAGYYDTRFNKSGPSTWTPTVIIDEDTNMTYAWEGDFDLVGTANITANVKDAKTGSLVDKGTVIEIVNHSTGLSSYRIGTDGSSFFSIDGELTYRITADAVGYEAVTDAGHGGAGHTGSGSFNITLTAYLEATVRDKANSWPIHQAVLKAYHFFEDYLNMSSSTEGFESLALNTTVLTIQVDCGDRIAGVNGMDDILVELNKSGTCYSYQTAPSPELCQPSLNTTNGTAEFRPVAAAAYNITISGDSVGCSSTADIIDIATGGYAYNRSYQLNATNLVLSVYDPRGVPLVNATASDLSEYTANFTRPEDKGYAGSAYGNSTGFAADENETYYYRYITSGNYTINVSDIHHRNGEVNCSANSGEVNNCSLTLQPYNGTLRINLSAEDGSALNDSSGDNLALPVVFVNATNAGETYTQAVNSTVNTTVFENSLFWNITVNATDYGYNHSALSRRYILPNDTTHGALSNNISLSLASNTLNITVLNNTQSFDNTNVTLWQGGSIATSYLGSALTQNVSSTGSGGSAVFTRLLYGDYNITLKFEDGEQYNYTYTVGGSAWADGKESLIIDIFEYELVFVVKNASGAALEGVTVNVKSSMVDDTNTTGSDGIASFRLSFGGLYNVTFDGGSIGYNRTIEEIDIGTFYNATIVLEKNYLLATITRQLYEEQNDTVPLEGANLTVYNATTGAIAETAAGDKLTALSGSDGAVLFSRVVPGTYRLVVWKHYYETYNSSFVIGHGITTFDNGTWYTKRVAPYFSSVAANASNYSDGSTVKLVVNADAPGHIVTADFLELDTQYAAGNETVVDKSNGTYEITYAVSWTNTRNDGSYNVTITAVNPFGLENSTKIELELSNPVPGFDETPYAAGGHGPDGNIFMDGETVTLVLDLENFAFNYTITANFSAVDSGYAAGDENVTMVSAEDDIYNVTYTIDAANTNPDSVYDVEVTAVKDYDLGNTTANISVVLDNTAPAQVTSIKVTPGMDAVDPTGGNITSASNGTNKINITFSPAVDNESGLYQQKIYRVSSSDGYNKYALDDISEATGDRLIAAVDASTTSYDDFNITAGATYWYGIVGVDTANNTVFYSQHQNNASASGNDSTIPVCTLSSVTASAGTYSINLSFAGSDSESGIKEYKVCRDTSVIDGLVNCTSDKILATLGSSATTYQDHSYAPSTTYYYAVICTNKRGLQNISSSQSASLSASDTTPPVTLPSSVNAVMGPYNVTVTWAAGADSESGAGEYWVYRDTVQIESKGQGTLVGKTTGTSFEEYTNDLSGTYYYGVVLYDKAGNSVIWDGTGDNNVSVIPSNTIRVSWTNPAETGLNYTIYRSQNETICTSENLGHNTTKVIGYTNDSYSFFDDSGGASPAYGSYYYAVTTKDYVGKENKSLTPGQSCTSGAVAGQASVQSLSLSAPSTATLTVEVTDSSYNPLPAVVTVYNEDGTRAASADGVELRAHTGDDGVITFENVPPSESYTAEVEKDVDGETRYNSTTFSIAAGEHLTVWIDPEQANGSYSIPVDQDGDIVSPLYTPTPEYPSLGDEGVYRSAAGSYWTVWVKAENESGAPINNAAVGLYRGGSGNSTAADDLYKGARTNNTGEEGVAVFENVLDGAYDIVVDGQGVGYGSTRINNVPLGKLVFSEGDSSSSGLATVVVDGQNPYYVRIEAAGYRTFDTCGGTNCTSDEFNTTTMTGRLEGSYYTLEPQPSDIEDGLSVGLDGAVTLAGRVSDVYHQSTDLLSIQRYINDAVLAMAISGTTRYSLNTSDNESSYPGYYAINVSPYTVESTLSSMTTAVYSLTVSKDGYHTHSESMTFNASQNTTQKDMELEGSGAVSGSIYDANTSQLLVVPPEYDSSFDTVISVLSADTGALMYQNTTRNGLFSITINPLYDEKTVRVVAKGYHSENSSAFNGSKTGLEFWLLAEPYYNVTFSVNGTGSSLADAIIKITRDGSTEVIELVTDALGRAWVVVYGYLYDILIDATELGYDFLETILDLTLEDLLSQQELAVELNATSLNISLESDEGGSLNSLDVTLVSNNCTALQQSSGLCNLTGTTDENGVVIFSPVPQALYNVTVDSGIYVNLSADPMLLNISDSMLGKFNNITYTLNQTRERVWVFDARTGLPVNITVIIRSSTGSEYSDVTDANGMVERMIPYGNYTIRQPIIELQDRGYQANFTDIYVEHGHDGSTLNNDTVLLDNTMVNLTIKNSTGSTLGNVNVTLYYNNSDYLTGSENGLGEQMKGSTDSDGNLTFYNVKPTSRVGYYSYGVNASSLGYGVWNYTGLSVPISGVDVNVTLRPVTVNVTVTAEGQPLASDKLVNISLLYSGSVASNALGQYMNASNVSGAVFTRALMQDYTLLVESDDYFSQQLDVNLGALTDPLNAMLNVTADLKLRNIEVNVYDYKDVYNAGRQKIDNSTFNITLVNATSGATLDYNTTSTGSATFTGVADGVYNVSAEETPFTVYNDPEPASIDTADPEAKTVELFPTKAGYGYANVTVMEAGVAVSGASVTLYNSSSASIDSSSTSSNGMAMLEADTTLYNSSLTVTASKSGYYSNTSSAFGLTAGGVEAISLSLEKLPPGDGGGGTGFTGGFAPYFPPQEETEEYDVTASASDVLDSLIESKYLVEHAASALGVSLDSAALSDMAEATSSMLEQTSVERSVNPETDEVTLALAYEGSATIYNLFIADELPSELSVAELTISSPGLEVKVDEERNAVMLHASELTPGSSLTVTYASSTDIGTSLLAVLEKPVFLLAGIPAAIEEAAEAAIDTCGNGICDPTDDCSCPDCARSPKCAGERTGLARYWPVLVLALIGLAAYMFLASRARAGYSFRQAPGAPLPPSTPPAVQAARAQPGPEPRLIADIGHGIDRVEKAIAKDTVAMEKAVAKEAGQLAAKEVRFVARQLGKGRYVAD